MTSAELKHRVKLQEWAARIQDCRSSGLSVRAWCRQEEINATTYYRWERELLALAETEPCSSVSAVRFAELPAPKRVSRNAAERSATLHILHLRLQELRAGDWRGRHCKGSEKACAAARQLCLRGGSGLSGSAEVYHVLPALPPGAGIQPSGLEAVPADDGQLAAERLGEMAAAGLRCAA